LHRPSTPEPAISLEFLVWAPVLLFSIVAHEYAHAEAAYRQGDDTAYVLGRITFNPLKHLDPFMSVIFPALLALANQPPFGAAKPVPVNPRKYRNYVRGDIIVSLAGIGANLVLFALSAALFAGVGLLASALPALESTFTIAQRMLFYGMWLNVILAFFNLLPIPPLDGSHVFYHLLPPQAGLQFRKLQALGFLPILLVVFVFPSALRTLLWPAQQLMAVGLAVVGDFAIGPAVWPS
jgi:Zn-dependent protease